RSGTPLLLAALTTMGGMLSLFAVPIVPIRHFALFSALGVWMTYLGSLFLLPVLMSFWAPKVKKNQNLKTLPNSFIQRVLQNAGAFGATQRSTAIFLFLVLAAIGVMGIPKIKVDSNLVEMIKPGYGFREAYQ